MSLISGIAVALVAYLVASILSKFVKVARSPLNNVAGPPSPSFLKGHVGKLFDANAQQFRDSLVEKYGGITRLQRLFGIPQLFICDPAALHVVLIKKHHIFEEPGIHLTLSGLMFGPGMTAVSGDHHKKQRKLHMPAFSLTQLRKTLPIMYGVTNQLRSSIISRLAPGEEWTELEMSDWIGRATLELIGQAGLGHPLDPLEDDEISPYGHAVKNLLPCLGPLVFVRRFLPLLIKIGSPQFRRRVVELMPFEAVKRFHKVIDILDEHAKKIYAKQMDSLRGGDQTIMHGKDILSRLLQANMEAAEDEVMSEEEMTGQISTLVVAGTDTTSSAICRTLHKLAEHPEVQDKLRKEIIESRRGRGDLPFDELFELPYLEAVCRETLRMYAPASVVSKMATEDTVLPLQNPMRGVNGETIREVFVPKGTNVVVGIDAANRDKAIWGEDAHEWKPERWMGPLPETLVQARMPGVYSNMLTFLGGGRACLGFKFAQCEMKVVLSVLLESLVFELPDKPIHWVMASIRYPSTGTHGKPEMPLKVKRICEG